MKQIVIDWKVLELTNAVVSCLSWNVCDSTRLVFSSSDNVMRDICEAIAKKL